MDAWLTDDVGDEVPVPDPLGVAICVEDCVWLGVEAPEADPLWVLLGVAVCEGERV